MQLISAKNINSTYLGVQPPTQIPKKIAKKAHKEGISLKEAAIALNLVSEKDFDKWVDPKKMIK